MKTELCFEIYFSKLKIYDFIRENLDNIIKLSVLTENKIENKILTDKAMKLNIFYVSRFLERSSFFVEELICFD